jgi:hypothetical protein
MTMLRLRSTEAPFDDTRVAGAAARLAAVAETLGLWRAKEPVNRLDTSLFEEVLGGVANAGVATFAPFDWHGYADKGGDSFAEWIDHVRDELADSPVPEHEIPVLDEMLGGDFLSRLIGVAPSSLRRYTAGQRVVPDPVAARAHVVALIVSDLAGSYNERGIRRWFERPRSQLGDRSPAEILSDDWDLDNVAVRRVKELSAERMG